jgi:hypothetical protein
MNPRDASLAALFALILAPGMAGANARLISVVPNDGGCVAGPTGAFVQSWDVEPGKSYTLTIDQVAECANGGTDPTLNVRVNSSAVGNTDLVATLAAAGTYSFTYTMPASGCGTFPIFYCTTPGNASTGLLVGRSDTGTLQAHLRAATFGPACSNPTEIQCDPTGTIRRSWGKVKTIYR